MGDHGGFNAMKKCFHANKSKFFFEKVNGKQFHAKYSGCDDFSVRLQIRKHKSVSWNKVAYKLCVTDWLDIFKTEGVCSTNETQLVASFRSKKAGDHRPCVKASKSFQKAVRLLKKTRKPTPYDWPIQCKLRK